MTENFPGRVPLARLDIGMLKALDSLLHERSVSGAARAMGLSQPSMSNALARLRRAFGDSLLVREGQTMVLTARAVEIAGRVSQIVADIAALEVPLQFDPATATDTFRIGVTDHSATVLMPDIIALVRDEAPGVRLMTVPIDPSFRDAETPGPMSPHLRMHWIRDAPPDWHIRKLLSEAMAVIGRKGHLELTGTLTLERFLTLDQVASSPNQSGFQTRADFELIQLGHKRRVVVTLAHFASLLPVVRKTDLIALFPRRLLEAFDIADHFEIVAPPMPFENFGTSLAWHPRYHHDPAHRWLRDLIGRAAARISD